MNIKADKFKKSQLKQMAMQSQSNAEQVGQQRQLVVALAQRLFEMDQTLNLMKARLSRAEATARYADYRTTALVRILQGAGNFTEEQILNEIEALQVKDFDHNSAVEDAKLNLEDAGQGPAENNQHAIYSVKLYKNGTELAAERIVRAKGQLGNPDDSRATLPGVFDAIVGMNVGESKRIPMDLQGQTDQAEITLLGLRKAKPEQPAATPEDNSGEQAGS